MRSPGPSCQVRCLSSTLGPAWTVTSSRSKTVLPSRALANFISSLRVARRRHVRDQLVGRLDAEARLGRTGGGAAPQPGQLLAHQVLPLGLLGGGDALALGAGEDVVGVAALVLVDRAALHVPHAGADLVEEPAVVGDADERGAARPQVLGQPGDALDVEVVGGLVEDDQVLLGDEQLGERDPAPLAAGERADDGVEALREAGQVEPAEEPGEHVADLGVARPLVVGHVADDLVPDGGGGVERVVLGEHAERAARRCG